VIVSFYLFFDEKIGMRFPWAAWGGFRNGGKS
jgi:hypothetical protein